MMIASAVAGVMIGKDMEVAKPLTTSLKNSIKHGPMGCRMLSAKTSAQQRSTSKTLMSPTASQKVPKSKLAAIKMLAQIVPLAIPLSHQGVLAWEPIQQNLAQENALTRSILAFNTMEIDAGAMTVGRTSPDMVLQNVMNLERVMQIISTRTSDLTLIICLLG
jgi:hypothetical protein